MHDFLLAKQIVDEVLKVAAENHALAGRNIKSVSVEIGSVTLAHDGHSEHMEDISIDNLRFGIENITRNTILKNTIFKIKKVAGESWRITDIEVE